MRYIFGHAEFDHHLMRIMRQVSYGGADLGECLATAKRVEDGNIESWLDEWVQTADQAVKDAEAAKSHQHLMSASESYLRAANYYTVATAFHYGISDDPRFILAFDKQLEAFKKAAEIFPHPVESIEVPFEETSLSAFLFKGDNSGTPRPTVVLNSGYERGHQEMYCLVGKGLIRRGYHVLTFDGPGQGSALIKQKLSMRPNWSEVLTSLVDCVSQHKAVDHEHLALLGIDWGAMLAALGASGEDRFRALITLPGQWDALYNIRRFFPEVTELLNKEDSQELAAAAAKILNSEWTALKFRARMHIHGVESAIELIKEWRNYTLENVVTSITCPTYVVDFEDEADQAKTFFEKLSCPKQYHQISNEHDSASLAQLNQKIFDWLDEQFEPKSLIKS